MGAATMKDSMEASPKVKIELSCDPAIPFGYQYKGNKNINSKVPAALKSSQKKKIQKNNAFPFKNYVLIRNGDLTTHKQKETFAFPVVL